VRLRAVFSIAVIVATLISSPAIASADELGGKRDQTRARLARVKGELNLALASDATVEAQLNRLTTEVTAQQNLVDDDRRTQTASAAVVTAAAGRLSAVEGRLDQSRAQLRALALRSYMRPSQIVVPGGVPDINEWARGRAFLSVGAASKVDVIDAFRQGQQDLTAAKSAMQAALDVATARTKLATDQAAQLVVAQHAQQASHAELQKRITDLRQESRDLAAQESGIEALIVAQSVRSAALGPTPLQPVAPSLPSGDVSPGPAISGSGLIWPLRGPVTSEFGARWGGFHPGIDIAPPFGTPIHAAKSGVVIFAGGAGGYGNFVLIDHSGGLVTGYAHQSRLAVTQGQSVAQGQVIGYEGSTGDSTGPHLHFEVRINARPQNPRGYESGNP